MSQVNTPIIEERLTFYSQFNIKELEIQLIEEKSFQNRNIIRQVIRRKRKEKEVTEKIDDKKKESLESVESQKEKLLSKECIGRKIMESEFKQLIYDEVSPNSNVMNAILNINDSLELIWVMPFKILSSIEYTWLINDKKINISETSQYIWSFDGKRASLKLKNLDVTDNGLYHLTIHSQRLKRKTLTFNIIVNTDFQKKELSSIILEDLVVEIVKPKIEIIPVSQYDSRPKPVHKNRFNRHKTMVGQEMLEGLKANQNKDSVQVNNIDETSNIFPSKPTVLKRFNRSATSARDIILTFCKLNTDEYEQYGVCVENLSTSWTDGLAFCALIHHFHPEAFDFSKLNKSNRRFNFELAFSSADKYAEIYPLLDIDDMMIMEKPDWKCIFTYLQCFYKTFRSHPKNKLKTVPIS